MALTSVITVWLLLASLYLKKKIKHMDEKAWTEYFQKISQTGMVSRLIILFVLSLLMVSTGAFWAFKILRFSEPMQMTVLFGIFTILCAGIDFVRNKDSLLQKISMFKK